MNSRTHQLLPIFIINLGRSTDRLKNITSLMNKEGFVFERVDAIDGSSLQVDKIEKKISRNHYAYFLPLNSGEIGCYLSHIKAIKLMVERKIEVALIMEDDIDLSPKFHNQLHSIMNEVANLPDVLKIYGSRRKGEVIASLKDGTRIIRSSSAPAGTPATIWTLQGAKKFLSTSQEINQPIDLELKHWWKHNINVCWVSPPTVNHISADPSLSNIGIRKTSSVTAELKKLKYRIRFFFLREWKYLSHYGIRSWLRSFQRIRHTH